MNQRLPFVPFLVYFCTPNRRVRGAKFANASSGQVGVIVLLIMVVLMTIGLSVATRSTQDLFLSQQRVDSTRVFNAAEAGVEEALSADLSFGVDGVAQGSFDFEDTTVNYTVTELNAIETLIFEGVSVEVDVTGATNGDRLEIDWSRVSGCGNDPASLVLSVFSNNGGNAAVRYLTIAGCNTRGDNFTNSSNGTAPYAYHYSLALQTNDAFVRIKPVYNDTHIRVVDDGWNIPVQFYRTRSEAQNNIGDEVRIVEVNRSTPSIPSILDYAVFSGTTITK